MVVRNRKPKSNLMMVFEHWTANHEHELWEEYQREERCYPQLGYGTMLLGVRQDPTGLVWHADFCRNTSCD